MTGLLLSAAIFLLPSTAAASPVPKRLCWAPGDCINLVCGQTVAASGRDRRYVIRDLRTGAYTFGVLKANELRPSCTAEVSLRLRVAKGSPIPERVRLQVNGEEGPLWATELTASAWGDGIPIALPEGSYQIELHAQDFVRWRAPLNTARSEVRVAFQPLPLITGLVLDAQSRKPIAGALIASDVETQTVSDATGLFQLRADPEVWPKEITVAADGRATASMRIPAARASTDLGSIRLTRAAAVDVALSAAPGQVKELELVEVESHGRAVKRRVRTLTLSSDGQRLRFESVAPGEYVVIAKGQRPWERMAEPVTVGDGPAEVALKIEPFDLSVRVEEGEMRIPRRRVLIRHRDLHWEGEFETDDSGEASLRLWQGGRLQCTVIAEGRLPYFARRDITAGDEQWVITLPDLELRGVVVDAGSGKPIPAASLALRMKSEEGYTLSVDARADDKGVFRFAPVVYGSHSLSAGAAGYPPAEMRIDFHAPESYRELTLKLTLGNAVRLAIVDERERPVSGALAIVYAGPVEEGRAVTDPSGTAEIAITSGSRTVFVIPRDGSFAIASVGSDERQKRIRIPDGLGTIELRAQGKPDEPIPGVSVVTRYNGTVLPLEVIETLAAMHGWRPRADADGRIVYTHVPAGTYEFWPVGSNAEFLAVSAGLGPRAPVSMAVGAGENVAVMSFERVGR